MSKRTWMTEDNWAKLSLKRRYLRHAQGAHRGTKVNITSQYEDALILLAWEAAELSEGQVCEALGIDRLQAREMKATALSKGAALASAMLDKVNRAR